MGNNPRRPSLDELAGRINANQTSGNAETRPPSQQVTVDNEAGIQFGDSPGNPSGRTQLPDDTYSGLFGASRKDKDREAVKKKMPANTRAHQTDEGIEGWVYSFKCQIGDRYTMFLYFDGANYQVMVISPRVENYWANPETGHIYSDGRICLSKRFGSGQPTLERAYAKSVVWATGFTAARRGNMPFPFNHNQAGA